MSCDCYCSLALPHGAVALPTVCDCGRIHLLFSDKTILTFSFRRLFIFRTYFPYLYIDCRNINIIGPDKEFLFA